MPELRRIRLTKTDLDRIPADERFFYLMAGHFANDVTILSQLLIAAFNCAFGRPGEFSRDEHHPRAQICVGSDRHGPCLVTSPDYHRSNRSSKREWMCG
jgi:hypothetical protein